MLPRNLGLLLRCFVVLPLVGTIYFFALGALIYSVVGLLQGFSRLALLIIVAGFSLIGLIIGILSGFDFRNRCRRIAALTSSEPAKFWRSILQRELIEGPDSILISIMRNLRGRYKANGPESFIFSFFMIFFGLIGPGLFTFLLCEKGFPYSPFDIQQVISCLMILIQPPMAAYLYFQWGRNYEFTGPSIVERGRSGCELNVFPIDAIEMVITESEAVTIIAGNRKMKIHIYNQLRSEMRRVVERIP